jgi:hypothetical protein
MSDELTQQLQQSPVYGFLGAIEDVLGPETMTDPETVEALEAALRDAFEIKQVEILVNELQYLENLKPLLLGSREDFMNRRTKDLDPQSETFKQAAAEQIGYVEGMTVYHEALERRLTEWVARGAEAQGVAHEED